MKKPTNLPFVLLVTLAIGVPASAQQSRAPIVQAPSTDQSASGSPDAGVRRAPAEGDPEGIPPALAPAGGIKGQPSPPPPPGDIPRSATAAKPLSAAEASAFAAAFKALDEGRRADARAAVANFRHTLLDRYVEWSILRTAPKTEASFAATWRFLRENPDWPEPEVLRRQAEDRIGAETPSLEVSRYFTAFPPLTSTGHMRRLEAVQTAKPEDVARIARDTWQSATLRPSDENEFTNRYGHLLTGQDHIARFDRILREGRAPVARELLSKLPPDYQPIASARLAMATRAADVASVLREVPAAKLNEPAIRLERAQWLRRTGNLDEANKTLTGSIASPTDAWWNERNQLAREFLTANRPADAYAMTTGHGLTKGIAFAEAEFLAGWLAFRHLKKPADALKHFQTLYEGVTADIWRSRAAYWLGRVHETAGRAKEASDWYGRAAAHSQTFYGQLAARKTPNSVIKLPSDPVASTAELQTHNGRPLLTMARYLGQAGSPERARPFLLRQAIDVTAPGEIALLAQFAMELKRPDVALTIARRAGNNGVVLFDAAFPVVDIASTGPIERPLALATTRQESSFNATAVSTSGALGLMQLLPSTARDVAGRLNTPFIQDKLTRDPAYNVQLGSQYMAEMLQRFGGSYELAVAAYNAGPNRVARWLETMGDPRAGKIDMVDWIEMIPFRETRNYVQRVMEGVVVYRERLAGPFSAVPPALSP